MDRRQYLRAIAAASTAAFAGCNSTQRTPTSFVDVTDGAPTATAGNTPTGRASATRTPTNEPTPHSPTAAAKGLPVPESELERGAPKDAIPAITEPEFADDWEGLVVTYYEPRLPGDARTEPRLSPADEVIGVTRNGDARAYPLKILSWHEIVNDDFHGPLLVTYCPLCATGITAVRKVNNRETVFGVSGLLYNSNLVMYDKRTDSLWSQVMGRAIRGSKTGAFLDFVQSSLTTWGEWQADHPDTKVLLPPPKSNTVRGRDAARNYIVDPYTLYQESDYAGLPGNEADRRINPKTSVIGISADGVTRAYPLPAVKEAGGVVNDTVGDLPVVVASTEEDSLFAYERTIDDETLTFEPADGATMTGGNSTWDVTMGKAINGSRTGVELAKANEIPALYWFSWVDFNPDTELFGGPDTPTPTADGS